ncbi:hypothetical protein D3C83_324040 [compost metagenome]
MWGGRSAGTERAGFRRVLGDENIGGFQTAMNDAALVSVGGGITDAREQVEALSAIRGGFLDELA